MSENPKKAHGALKPSLHYAPMNAMLSVARVFELGAYKYGLKNYREQPVDVSTYYDAALRHLIEYFEHGVDVDPESNQSPLAHVIACCMIVMDGVERQSIIDDRKDFEVLHPKSLSPAPLAAKLEVSTRDQIDTNSLQRLMDAAAARAAE